MKLLKKTCASCGKSFSVSENIPVNFVCQSCGFARGFFSLESQTSGVIWLICEECKEEVPIVLGQEVSLTHKCRSKIFRWAGSGKLSSATTGLNTSEDIAAPVGYTEASPRKRDFSIKICIPYYEGPWRTKVASRTWLYPEVVFALTDVGVIPPGTGTCSQFFLPRNGTEIPGVKKTKPFLLDALRATKDLYPDCDYYGFFNSDIILPPGRSLYDLAPDFGRKIAFHHRKEVHLPESHDIRKVRMGSDIEVGKDGFIARKDVLEDILEEFPDVLVGSPCWDSSLFVWALDRYTKKNLDVRYGEIWHSTHDQDWAYEDPDSKYNASLFAEPEHVRVKRDWGRIRETALFEDAGKRKVPPRLGIIQPGRIGDILIVLPIAKWYFDQGYEVHWPVADEFLPLFDYVNYVKPIPAGPLSGAYSQSLKLLDVDIILDLAIGFGCPSEADWIKSGKSFDEWKYYTARVPFKQKRKLDIIRDLEKEGALKKQLKLDQFPEGYVVTHSKGTVGEAKWDIPNAVEVRPVPGFTIFDWIGVIELANSLVCVDSCVANLADQLNLLPENRYIHTWEKERPDKSHRERLTPKLKGWKKDTGFVLEKEEPLFSVIIIVWNGEPFIGPCLENIYDFAHEIFVVEGAVKEAHSIAPEDGSSTDGTIETVQGFPDPENKIRFYQGKWEKRVDMQNSVMGEVTGNYIFQVDVDEFWKEEDLEEIQKMVRSRSEAKEFRFRPLNFFKGFDYYFTANEIENGQGARRIFKFVPGSRLIDHAPPQLQYPDGSLSSEKNVLVPHIRFFHFNYVLPDQVENKVKMYQTVPHFSQVDYMGWYEGFFKKWSPENRGEMENGGKYGPWPVNRESYTIKYEGDFPKSVQKLKEKLSGPKLRRIQNDHGTFGRSRKVDNEEVRAAH